MPDNQNAVMVVARHASGPVPNGWTHFPADGLIARRAIYADYRKMFRSNLEVVAIFVYQQNPSGASPLATVFSGNDGYAFEDDAENSGFNCSRFISTGSGAGTDRVTFSAVTGGGASQEHWPKEQGQVPMLGVALQDGNPTQAELDAAFALTTDDVPLG
jgi:hypothetical protein